MYSTSTTAPRPASSSDTGAHARSTSFYEADVAVSEAGSVNELNAARSSIGEASTLDPAARALLDQRMRERLAQLRQLDRARTVNLLSSAPFNAATNATSPVLVEDGSKSAVGGGAEDGSLPFDVRQWAEYLERLAPELRSVAPHLETHTTQLARSLVSVAAANQQETSDAAQLRQYVAVVGRRGVGRGAVIQALTSAGGIASSERVGSKMLPVVFRHDDSVADEPVLPMSQLVRVWLPLERAVDDAWRRPEHGAQIEAAMQRYPGLKARHGAYGRENWAAAAAARGTAVETHIAYAHAALLALSDVGMADNVLHGIFWGGARGSSAAASASGLRAADGGPTVGPPEVRCRFPWLRGCKSTSMGLLDVPTPDDEADFMPRVVNSVLAHTITAVVVEEARPRSTVSVSAASVFGGSGGQPPAKPAAPSYYSDCPGLVGSLQYDAAGQPVVGSATTTSSGPRAAAAASSSSGASQFGGPDALWSVLASYAKQREVAHESSRSRSGAATTSPAPWDGDDIPPILVALTLPVVHRPTDGAVDGTQLAIKCHVRLRRQFGVSVALSNMFVVAPQAALAVVQLFDLTAALVHEGDDVSDAPPQQQAQGGNADVTQILTALHANGLRDPWRACLKRAALADTADADTQTAATRRKAPEPPEAADLCDLLAQNDRVWRMSGMGWLVSALLQNVVAGHEVPSRIAQLRRAVAAVDDVCHCVTDAMLRPEVYGESTVPQETNFAGHVRSAVGPVTGLLKQLLVGAEEQATKLRDETPKPIAPPPMSRAAPTSSTDITGHISAALDEAQDRVSRTRLSLAHIVRTKVAAVTALRAVARDRSASTRDGGDGAASATGSSSTSSRPPRFAVQAVDAIGKRAAAVLQGSTVDVGIIAEALYTWWHQLPDDIRIGEQTDEAVAFKTGLSEAAFRLTFGIPEVASELAESDDVVGNSMLHVSSKALRDLGTNPVLRSALVTKSVRDLPGPDWPSMSPPLPTADITHRVTEHSALNATSMLTTSLGSGPGRQPDLQLEVRDVGVQTHRELLSHLCAVQRFLAEALAAAVHYEERLNAIAAAALCVRFGELGRREINLQAKLTTDGKVYSPLVAAFAALHTLSGSLHAELARQHHALAASIVRPDDELAHLGLEEDETTSVLLYSVSRLHESHAEWRRWRVEFHRESAASAATVTNAVADIALRHLPLHLRPPTLTPLSASGLDIEPISPGRASRGGTSSFRDRAIPLQTEPSTGSKIARPLPAHVVAQRKKAVVCLCGGGVRGVLTALFVQRLDSIVQARFSVAGKRRCRIWDVVDEFIGTSTGAIVASLIAIGVEPSAIVNLYRNNADKIFPQSTVNTVAATAAAKPKYDPAGRHEIAKRFMGRRRMNDDTIYAGIARAKMLLCDLSNLRTRVLTCDDDVSFVDGLMAATAAPTFFPAVKIGSTYYCDGGIAENHPGLEVAKDMANVEHVVTIGTGISPTNYQHMHNAGLLQWAPCFADVFIDTTQTVAEQVLETLFGPRSTLINVALPPKKMALDDPATIPILTDLAMDFMDDNATLFEQTAEALYAATIGSTGGAAGDMPDTPM